MPKPIILTFVGCYLPGYKAGGPVRTIANMVSMLSDELDFRIITSDRDLFETSPYSNVVTDAWNTVGKAKVFYASPKMRSLWCISRLIRETPHNVLYLNSFFSPVFTQIPLLARWLGMIPRCPTIVAPRGEFSKGALALKAWKKHPYIATVKLLGVYKDITWQASSEFEADAIRQAMGITAKRIVLAIVLAPDMSDGVESVQASTGHYLRAIGDPLRVCFLSRICPMKNLDFALRVLTHVKVPVEFAVYGVAEDAAYWAHCQNLAKNLPAHVTFRYHGKIDHEKVNMALASHDLFFLPTRGENYGHVIFEALAAGLPVLISDQTPWRNLETLGVGWDLPLMAEEKFCAVLEAQAALSHEEWVAQRLRAKEHARLIATDEKVLADNFALFKGIIADKQIILPYLKD
jgi:glycosyltransferase involved in cell wall biosynthesis